MTERKLVSFFGSIGTGKTTAGECVARLYPQIGFVPEGLEDNPYLSRFYDDMKRWGFLSSLEMLAGMAGQLHLSDREIVILDNGIRELICYTRVERDMGILSPQEFDTYEKLYHAFLANTPEMELYVFFYCDVQTQLQRIKARGRPYEQQLTAPFLEALNREYETYLPTLPQERLMLIDTDDLTDYRELGREILTRLGEA